MNRCPPGVDSSFFSIPVLPGQRRQGHDPSRSFPVDLRCQHGSTRFTQVGLPFPVLQGSPRLFLTCQKPPERPPVHPGPSGIIPVHHGGLRFNPRYSPVHPGPWTGVNRGVPGAQWDWGITFPPWHTCSFRHQIDFSLNYSTTMQLLQDGYSLT